MSSSSYYSASSWQSLGADAYRSVSLYDTMLWSNSLGNLDDYLVVGSPFGGAIAVTNKTTHLVSYRASGVGASDTVSIFAANGSQLGLITMAKHSGPLFTMAWTAAEHLALIYEDGSVDM